MPAGDAAQTEAGEPEASAPLPADAAGGAGADGDGSGGAFHALPGDAGDGPPAPGPSAAQAGAQTTALARLRALRAPQTQDPPVSAAPFEFLGTRVLPGSQARLAFAGADTFAGLATPTPVLVAHGAMPGPVVCLVAAVHGDELNGIEVVRRVYYDLRPTALRGTVLGVPIVNQSGFRSGSRYLPDRRDLNRYFPGDARGSAAARIAHGFFEQVVRHCDALVDLHTGSLHRTNLPHVRANLGDAGARLLADHFVLLPVLNDPPIAGTLRDAAAAHGIAAVTIEAGSPSQLQSDQVRAGTRAVRAMLASLGMTDDPVPGRGPAERFERAIWVRAESGGILLSSVQPGARVRAGQRLGTVADPITNASVPIVAPRDGVVLGLALDQVVMPGFATHHLALPMPAAGEEDGPAGAAQAPDLPEAPAVSAPGAEEDRPE